MWFPARWTPGPSTPRSSRSSRRHAVAPRWGRRPQRHSGGGGSAPKAATRVGVDSAPKHLDIFQGAPLRLPKPLSDQFPVRVCSCPLCIINRLWGDRRRRGHAFCLFFSDRGSISSDGPISLLVATWNMPAPIPIFLYFHFTSLHKRGPTKRD